MSERKKNQNFWKIFFLKFFSFLTLSWTIPTICKKNFSNRPSSLATLSCTHTYILKLLLVWNVAKLLGRFEKIFLKMVGMVQDSVRYFLFKKKKFKIFFFSKILKKKIEIFILEKKKICHYPRPYLPSAKRIFQIGPAVWPHL